MKRLLLILLLLFASGIPSVRAMSPVDVFWIDRYGEISWNEEKVRLDNFAIQLMSEPNQVGYIVVKVGLVSCKGEAQARALRAKNYMVRVRDVPESRIIWRDIGYRDSLEVSLWLAPLSKPAPYNPDFKSATAKHVIRKCVGRIPKLSSGD
jgi:hypothetical protein